MLIATFQFLYILVILPKEKTAHIQFPLNPGLDSHWYYTHFSQLTDRWVMTQCFFLRKASAIPLSLLSLSDFSLFSKSICGLHCHKLEILRNKCGKATLTGWLSSKLSPQQNVDGAMSLEAALLEVLADFCLISNLDWGTWKDEFFFVNITQPQKCLLWGFIMKAMNWRKSLFYFQIT